VTTATSTTWQRLNHRGRPYRWRYLPGQRPETWNPEDRMREGDPRHRPPGKAFELEYLCFRGRTWKKAGSPEMIVEVWQLVRFQALRGD